MDNFKVPAKEIDLRIKGIQRELQSSGIDALLVVQRVDLFYFTGTAQNAFLYVPAEGSPLLMVRKYFKRALLETSIEEVVEIKSVKEIPSLISDRYGSLPGTLGLEFDVIPVRDFYFYRGLFPHTDCVDASPLILRLRMVKTDWEIEQISRSGELSYRTFMYIKEIMRPGISEMELAGMFETFARRFGHGGKLRVRDYQTEGYPWHVLSGKNGGKVGLLDSPSSGEGTSPAFPCGAGKKKILPNEPVMVDLGTVINGYHFDETRMFSFGMMPKKALDACKAVIEIHNAVLERVTPGIPVHELYEFSVKKADALGYSGVYLGPEGYKVKFIGHGIGLELVEQPIIAKKRKDVLLPRMTFALEPKMAFEDEFAAGIESVFVVTESGARLLSKTPAEVFIL